MKYVLTTLIVALAALSPVVGFSQDSLRLYVLDGGTLMNPDPSWAGVTVEDIKGFTSLPSPAFLVVHADGTLLWDAGLGDDRVGLPVAEPERGPWRQVVTKSLRSQLAEIGYAPEDITYFAISHMHFDHVGNAGDYVNSIWIVQQAEFERPPTYSATSMAAFNQANSGETITPSGDYDVFGDGSVVLRSTPGHTAGHQSLFVDLPGAGPVLVSGDLWHYAAERELGKMPPGEIGPGVTAASRASIEMFLRETGADLWIQHDPMEWATRRKSPAYYE